MKKNIFILAAIIGLAVSSIIVSCSKENSNAPLSESAPMVNKGGAIYKLDLEFV